ncbi:haloacid dehalogenase [Annulohypoxylon maeteangense]|uniref:haloacid dehalogenase n=1 Tax=Annulohypoxylon maeteangense TaxID=1927788 RepID=UPI002007ACC4|nr:haloacid dehalogenase [Annulohypoxylon maeteangense]KAI0880846.1 haloacid dehalogenase [Annulohypoxylon maeteangense]
MAPKTIIAFDLYGTLLSTESIADELAKIYGQDQAKSLAALWRRYQLEYTWRINSMGEYKTFGEITRNALHHAVAEHGLTLAPENTDALMRSYDALHVFPEIPSALKLLEENGDSVEAYVFSNGTGEMVGNSIKTSPDLGPHSGRFKSLITVDDIKCFKPDRRSYNHLLEHVGKQEDKGDVWLVSANPFDIVGARAAGLKASFIDRSGKGWIDRLDEKRAPSVIASGVDEAIKLILNY